MHMIPKKTIFTVGFLVFLIAFAFAQDTAVPQSELERLAGNVYTVSNIRGGNVAVLLGEDGVLVVDSGTRPDDAQRLQAAVSEMTDQPIRYVINTHWHSDHVGGNEGLAKIGATIVAHEKVTERLASEQYLEFFDEKSGPAPEEALPQMTFTDRLSIHFSGENIEIFHVQPGHTDGDGIVYFKRADVIHVGDLFFNGYYPYIGISSGGSIMFMVDVIRHILPRLTDTTIVIPGHGPMSNRGELKAYAEMLATIGERVNMMVRAGKALEEIKASKPTAEFDESWGQIWMSGDQFVELVYMDLSR